MRRVVQFFVDEPSQSETVLTWIAKCTAGALVVWSLVAACLIYGAAS